MQFMHDGFNAVKIIASIRILLGIKNASTPLNMDFWNEYYIILTFNIVHECFTNFIVFEQKKQNFFILISFSLDIKSVRYWSLLAGKLLENRNIYILKNVQPQYSSTGYLLIVNAAEIRMQNIFVENLLHFPFYAVFSENIACATIDEQVAGFLFSRNAKFM